MTLVLRRAIPVLMAALALANTGCGSKSDRTPTGPRPPVIGGDDGRVTAMAAPPLGSVRRFGVLAGAGVTAVGAAIITGDVGSCPTAAGAQPPGMIVVAPSVYRQAGGDAVSCQAQADATVASANLLGQGPGNGGLLPQLNNNGPVPPGVYSFPAAVDIAAGTTFTLSGAGSYVFIVGSAITANVGSDVILINGADPCQVFWRAGTFATISGFNFPGTVIAHTQAVTLNGGINPVNIGANGIPGGRVVSRIAAVTMPGNFQKTVGGCFAAVVPPGGVPALPHGMEWALLVILVVIGAYVVSRR